MSHVGLEQNSDISADLRVLNLIIRILFKSCFYLLEKII